jgi:anthranilate synthase/aminodeoxychorismate synthase-like glutamine amidotransferase
LRIAFIDHYDSFSFNVLAWLRKASTSKLDIKHVACDDETGLARLKNDPIPLVISPGPGKPDNYPLTMRVLDHLMPKVPILGICLGHQMLGVKAGGKIIRAEDPWHGTRETVTIETNNWLTDGLSQTFHAITYNSLVVDLSESKNSDWLPLAFDPKKQLMMLSHRDLPLASVQFHPESFNSPHLDALARNFLSRVQS